MATPSAYLLERYEATPHPDGVHIARPLIELIDDIEDDDASGFWKGAASWPRPLLHLDLDDEGEGA